MPNFHPIVLLSTIAVLGCVQSPAGPIDSYTLDSGVITTSTTTTPSTTTTSTGDTGTETKWDGTWTGTIDVRMDDFNGGQDACQAVLTLVVDSTVVPQISGRADCRFTNELEGVVDVDFDGDLLLLGGSYRLAYDLVDDFSAWDGAFVDEVTFRGTFDGDNYGYADAYIFIWSGDFELTRQ